MKYICSYYLRNLPLHARQLWRDIRFNTHFLMRYRNPLGSLSHSSVAFPVNKCASRIFTISLWRANASLVSVLPLLDFSFQILLCPNTIHCPSWIHDSRLAHLIIHLFEAWFQQRTYRSDERNLSELVRIALRVNVKSLFWLKWHCGRWLCPGTFVSSRCQQINNLILTSLSK